MQAALSHLATSWLHHRPTTNLSTSRQPSQVNPCDIPASLLTCNFPRISNTNLDGKWKITVETLYLFIHSRFLVPPGPYSTLAHPSLVQFIFTSRNLSKFSQGCTVLVMTPPFPGHSSSGSKMADKSLSRNPNVIYSYSSPGPILTFRDPRIIHNDSELPLSQPRRFFWLLLFSYFGGCQALSENESPAFLQLLRLVHYLGTQLALRPPFLPSRRL